MCNIIMSITMNYQGLLLLVILVVMFPTLESRQTNTTLDALQEEPKYFCYGPGSCLNVAYSQITYLQHAIASPDYVMLVRDIRETVPVDNACITIFKGYNDNSFLAVRSVIYEDDTEFFEIVIITDTPNNPGRYSSAGIIGDDVLLLANKGFTLNVTCPGSDTITNFYDCHVYVPYNERDDFVGVSSSPNPSEGCIREAQQLLEAASGLTFKRLPYEKPYKCVTRLNGVPCFNANYVDPKYSIEL